MGNTSPQPAKRTAMPTTAGTLIIISGVIHLVLGITVASLSQIIGLLAGFWGMGAIGVPLVILGAVSITGGVFALQRRIWGIALIGAICALIWPLSVLGLAAVILVVLSKQEFT